EYQAEPAGEHDAGADTGEHDAREPRTPELREPAERPGGDEHEHPGAGDAGERTPERPGGEARAEAHDEGAGRDEHESEADRGRRRKAQPDSPHRTGEVPEIVRR